MTKPEKSPTEPAAGVFRAAARIERAGGHEDEADRFDEFAEDRTFCIAVSALLAKESA